MRLYFAFLLSTFATLSTPAAEPINYATDVFPILEAYCLGCHTSDEAQGEFVLETYEALMRGGETGLAVTPGTPGSSRMMRMALGKLDPVMPPEGSERPSEEELAILEAWIEQGAVGPDGDMPLKRKLRTPKIETSQDVTLPVTAIAISADGKQKAVARFGKIEILGKDSALLTTLSTELGKINSLSFSKNGSRLLVGSGLAGSFGSAAILLLPTGEMEQELVGHRDTLYAATFSPDETKIATAGYDKDIILWDAKTGEPIRNFPGHNGAVFDLAFSPDGKLLVSGCADETVKVWNVESGERLDTLSQPEGEVFAVDITADGKFVLAASSDNRLRVWKLLSKENPRINPIVATRFIDESPLVNFKTTADGKHIIVLSQSGNIKIVRCVDWMQIETLESLDAVGSDLCVSPDNRTVWISVMNGDIVERQIPDLENQKPQQAERIAPVYLDLGEPTAHDEAELANPTGTSPGSDEILDIVRGAKISAAISKPGEVDLYRWHAHRGEVWAIDVDATKKSRIDPIVSVLDEKGDPVLRARLQAIRDSYFTFRGKDSSEIGDFRLFNWREMHLNDFLYASGEVVRLAMHPRGPDSGFNVYPNEGNRWTYFGTSAITHALGDPSYIVRALQRGEEPTANGLPVFDVYYENDDDPQRVAQKNSRLLFTAPDDGEYIVRVTDTRGEGGDNYQYSCVIRAAQPSFQPSVQPIGKPIGRGSGREFIVRVNRIDGFDGPVIFDIPDLPEGVVANVPLKIEEGQRFARGTIWVSKDAEGWEGKQTPSVTATAEILGRSVERSAGTVGDLTIADRPKVIPVLQPLDQIVPSEEDWTLQVRRGETVSARVVLDRKEGFKNEVSFGKEDSGRNASQGVYVDNIGLNGLLALEGMTERDFYITADPTTKPGKRSFFLRAEVDGGITSRPITLEVLP